MADPSEVTRQLREARFQLNQRIAQLETLHHAGILLGGSLEVDALVGEFLLLAVALADARGGVLFLRQSPSRRLDLVQHANLSPGELDAVATGGVYRRLRAVMRRGTCIALGPGELPDGVPVAHLLAVPMGDEGFIALVDRESRSGVQPFRESDAHLLELTCQQAGAALANARLYRGMVEERNLNQSIVSSIANGVISTDSRGRIVQRNPAVERIFAGEPGLVGKSCAQLFRRHGCHAVAAAVRASLKDGRPRSVDADALRAADLSINARVSMRRDAQGEPLGVVVALEDLTEQNRVRTMFKQYASDKVVDLLLASGTPPALGGEQLDATVLFVDLSGSTELLGQIGAEEMVRLLNDCFTRMVDVIFRFNGTLDKYTGDGFMAVYGVPVAFADDAHRAARSALAIRDQMRRFNRDNGVAWAMKMGITQGPVVAGNIGSPRRMEYTVIGPDVSLAARLSDRARAGQILVSSQVHAALGERFAFETAGHQIFRGIRQPVEVFSLVGLPGRRQQDSEREDTRSMKDESARVDLSIPMIPDMELTATQTAEAVGSFMKLDEDKIEEVKMALIEACINAIEHSQSKDNRLQIDFEMNDVGLTIVISDRGHGFDVGSVRADLRRRRASGQRKRGWGLRLMEELMDKVDFDSGRNGTTITLVKYR